MTENSCPRVSSSESDSSTTKQRKRRKWDQPDESLVSAGIAAVQRSFPLANLGSLTQITSPIVSSVCGASLAVPLSTSSASPLVLQLPLQQHAAAIVQKFVQPKIQDELIAREIVINDAEAAIRYKLTKRQTQEEIQKSTGAVVITRGKYRPPNALPDGERSLYLHISAAAHLETTAERIKAVDHAAAMVEEMLKQASLSGGVKVDHSLHTCVFLGFEADPSMNIASRIRGPNDQYVNHIVNETGATVLLRGLGSGFFENEQTEETQQPLHLLLSSNDPRSLERAKLLAENLLDTISAEFGASRISSSKVYGAVPPPPQLQARVQSPGGTSKVNDLDPSSSTTLSSLSCVSSQSQGPSQSVVLSNSGLPLANSTSYAHGLTSGTSYMGYGGIFPQVTPLQQVALALRQSTSQITSTVSPTTTVGNTNPTTDMPSARKDMRPHKRKFQELPTAAGPAKLNQKNVQGSEFPMPRELTSNVGAREISTMEDPKFVNQPTNGIRLPPPPPSKFSLNPKVHKDGGMEKSKHEIALDTLMPLPPPRSVTPLTPPPKFNSTSKVHHDSGMPKLIQEIVPDTLIKLMEYGDDDEEEDVDGDLEETPRKPLENQSCAKAVPKPFWAL